MQYGTRKGRHKKTGLLKSVGLLAICLGGFSVTEKAYAFTGWYEIGVSTDPYNNIYDTQNVAENMSLGTQSFLSSVWGPFTASSCIGTCISVASIFVGPDQSSSDLDLFLSLHQANSSGSGTSVLGMAVFPGDPNAVVASCDPSNPETDLPAPNGATKWACYLTEISSALTDTEDDFDSWSDEAAIDWTTDSTTQVNCQPGSIFPNTGTSCRGNAKLHCYNNARAKATCVPISTWLGWGSTGNTNNDTGPYSLGPMINGKACLLSQIWGSLGSNVETVGAWWSNGNWFLSAHAGTGATVDCIE